MHPKAFPEALTVSSYLLRACIPRLSREALPASNYSVAGYCHAGLSGLCSLPGRDKSVGVGEKDSTDVNEKSGCS